ncbi:sensor histidine kinase [Salipaludibacillus sp. HK11]|uniref:sensor histidine kinase n=1 Tax=Salipaludibacillus sp. HK11 TaxID=3394320 RepID=UPI0039FC455D
MYTSDKKKIVEFFEKSKRETVSDMMELFRDTPKGKRKCEQEVLRNALDSLFDLYLLNISSKDHINNIYFEKIIEEYNGTDDINLDEFINNFEEMRLIIEKKVYLIPISEFEKTKIIAQLNKFFLEIQYYFYVESINRKNNRISEKEIQLSHLKKDRSEILTKLSMSFAHEIRNPLTSIKGFIQILEKRFAKIEEEKRYFELIYKDMEALEQQVDQLLFLSNEKNHQDINFSSIYLNAILFDVVDAFQPFFSQNNISVNLDLSEKISTTGMEEQVKLVLIKLMQNALDALLLRIKDRKLYIRLKRDDSEAVITFSNNGPPIPRLIRHSMFEPFVGTKELGKGLGLAVSKQLMRKHEGDINYISNEEWTIFKLRFPIKKNISMNQSE